MFRHFSFPTMWLIVLAASLLTLSGCCTPAPAVVQTKYVVVHPSASLIEDCPDTVTPPDPKLYVAASAKDKERMLYEYASSQQAERQKCNVRWAGVRQWFVDQDKVYSTPQGASSPVK